MPRFFRRLAEGVFDVEDLKFRTNELADFVVKASKKYWFDPKIRGRSRLLQRSKHCSEFAAAPPRDSERRHFV